jgi:2-methylcitrate dehydratase PrpD
MANHRQRPAKRVSFLSLLTGEVADDVVEMVKLLVLDRLGVGGMLSLSVAELKIDAKFSTDLKDLRVIMRNSQLFRHTCH